MEVLRGEPHRCRLLHPFAQRLLQRLLRLRLLQLQRVHLVKFISRDRGFYLRRKVGGVQGLLGGVVFGNLAHQRFDGL